MVTGYLLVLYMNLRIPQGEPGVRSTQRSIYAEDWSTQRKCLRRGLRVTQTCRRYPDTRNTRAWPIMSAVMLPLLLPPGFRSTCSTTARNAPQCARRCRAWSRTDSCIVTSKAVSPVAAATAGALVTRFPARLLTPSHRPGAPDVGRRGSQPGC